MPITIQCECGARLVAPDALIGKSAQCGSCGRVLMIAAPLDLLGDDTQEADLAETAPAPRLPPRLIRRKKKVFRKQTLPDDQSTPSRSRKRPPRPARGTAEGAPFRGSGLIEGWARALQFPLRREALITILVLAAIYGPFMSTLAVVPLFLALALKWMVSAGLLTAGIFGYFCYFLLQTLRTTAQNEDDLPVAAAFDFEEIFIDLWLLAGGTALNFSPLLVLESALWFMDDSLSGLAVWLTFGGLVFLWPMAVMASALHTSVLAANHWTVITSILRIPLQYTATIAVSAGLVGVVVAVDYFIPRIFIVSGFISWFLMLFTVTALMSLLGNLYYRNRDRIGWFKHR